MLYCVHKYLGPIVRYRHRYTLLPATIYEISRDIARDSQLGLDYSTYEPLFQLLLMEPSAQDIFVLPVATRASWGQETWTSHASPKQPHVFEASHTRGWQAMSEVIRPSLARLNEGCLHCSHIVFGAVFAWQQLTVNFNVVVTTVICPPVLDHDVLLVRWHWHTMPPGYSIHLFLCSLCGLLDIRRDMKRDRVFFGLWQ